MQRYESEPHASEALWMSCFDFHDDDVYQFKLQWPVLCQSIYRETVGPDCQMARTAESPDQHQPVSEMEMGNNRCHRRKSGDQ
jgi:hypothetical protein